MPWGSTHLLDLSQIGFNYLAADPEREINFEMYTVCMIKKYNIC